MGGGGVEVPVICWIGGRNKKTYFQYYEKNEIARKVLSIVTTSASSEKQGWTGISTWPPRQGVMGPVWWSMGPS